MRRRGGEAERRTRGREDERLRLEKRRRETIFETILKQFSFFLFYNINENTQKSAHCIA